MRLTKVAVQLNTGNAAGGDQLMTATNNRSTIHVINNNLKQTFVFCKARMANYATILCIHVRMCGTNIQTYLSQNNINMTHTHNNIICLLIPCGQQISIK